MTDKKQPIMKPEIYVGISYGVRNKNPQQVLDIICSVFGVTQEKLASSERQRPYPDARKVFFALARKYNVETKTTELGKMLNKDHSTVVTATKKAYYIYPVDKLFRKLMDRCDHIVRGGMPVDEADKENFKSCIGYYYNNKAELNEFARAL